MGRLTKFDLGLIFVVVAFIIAMIVNLVIFSKGYADTRNAQRSEDVMIISQAVAEFMQTSRYRINELGVVPICPQTNKIGTATGSIDLSVKLQETSLVTVPLDPSGGTAADTGYAICITESSRIEVIATRAENGKIIITKQ